MIDVLIVGAGPAGISASIVCARAGLNVKVVDEFVRAGGRLLGQLHEEPNRKWWNGIEIAERLVAEARVLGVEFEMGVSVYNLKQLGDEWKVYTTKETVRVKALLLATGAAETALPIAGWTLPGVMSIGAAQVMTNVHRVRPGQRGVIVGVNILSTAIARELVLAGVEVESMLLPAKSLMTEEDGDPGKVMESLLRVAHLAPSKILRFGSGLMKSASMKRLGLKFYPKSGFRVWGIPVKLRQAVVEIAGSKQVEGVRVVDIDVEGNPVEGSERLIAADFVCIAGGLYPLVELAAVAGCSFRYIEELGGHVPVHNEKMKTGLKGLYVAGNITGIESAKVAIAQGEVAGYSIALDLLLNRSFEGPLRAALEKVESTRQNAEIQFHPEIEKGREQMEMAFKVLEAETRNQLYAKKG
ncbi:sarcosine oxidase subunit alpha [Bacillus sp. MUM 116]|uniref:NAD(P)/FAD-dependent oxidoreductase n=1 Tax=Bacillus sp. MUM 116 TaxID=1678002 RepID=UPI0008F58394|nr:NAD(P)/FAD-dependent oxidoreductase [Bacillus sp. MUM 116]OIK10546.1 sarcosine oxidase subunit alpha [Bacillus sp. MUM 116]